MPKMQAMGVGGVAERGDLSPLASAIKSNHHFLLLLTVGASPRNTEVLVRRGRGVDPVMFS